MAQDIHTMISILEHKALSLGPLSPGNDSGSRLFLSEEIVLIQCWGENWKRKVCGPDLNDWTFSVNSFWGDFNWILTYNPRNSYSCLWVTQWLEYWLDFIHSGEFVGLILGWEIGPEKQDSTYTVNDMARPTKSLNESEVFKSTNLTEHRQFEEYFRYIAIFTPPE